MGLLRAGSRRIDRARDGTGGRARGARGRRRRIRARTSRAPFRRARGGVSAVAGARQVGPVRRPVRRDRARRPGASPAPRTAFSAMAGIAARRPRRLSAALALPIRTRPREWAARAAPERVRWPGPARHNSKAAAARGIDRACDAVLTLDTEDPERLLC